MLSGQFRPCVILRPRIGPESMAPGAHAVLKFYIPSKTALDKTPSVAYEPPSHSITPLTKALRVRLAGRGPGDNASGGKGRARRQTGESIPCRRTGVMGEGNMQIAPLFLQGRRERGR